MKPPEERDFVRALTRGLDVILAFSHLRPSMTLSEVAEVVGLSRPTARRLLLTLEDAGFVKTDARRFSLTPRVLALGYAYLSSLDLAQVAQPHMDALVKLTGEGCAMAVLDDCDVVYVNRVPTHRITSLPLTTGTRLPAHATSMGQVLLADLTPDQLESYLTRADLPRLTARTLHSPHEIRSRMEQVRQHGWALVDQELEEGLRSISAPVMGAEGRTVAAVGMSTTVSSTTLERLRSEHVPHLVAAAAAISKDLGGRVAAERES
ncbi:IclR family transcriptional regulator domain-containing protein [Aeromicrobium alkaliterrae]|uniref:IclR family transcriptional regulator C-terminal domain-containing protein n=1 Tax=Aeromicrobium alkaliterrae TaxID=302168 RepID=A0ABN2KEJ6_9ACTN